MAILAAIFMIVKVLPAFGVKEVTMTTWHPSFWPTIKSRFVRRTRKASFIISRLPPWTIIAQLESSKRSVRKRFQ